MRNTASHIRKHPYTTVLDDADDAIFEAAQRALNVNRSEFLRQAGLHYAKHLKTGAVKKKLPKRRLSSRPQATV